MEITHPVIVFADDAIPTLYVDVADAPRDLEDYDIDTFVGFDATGAKLRFAAAANRGVTILPAEHMPSDADVDELRSLLLRALALRGVALDETSSMSVLLQHALEQFRYRCRNPFEGLMQGLCRALTRVRRAG